MSDESTGGPRPGSSNILPRSPLRPQYVADWEINELLASHRSVVLNGVGPWDGLSLVELLLDLCDARGTLAAGERERDALRRAVTLVLPDLQRLGGPLGPFDVADERRAVLRAHAETLLRAIGGTPSHE